MFAPRDSGESHMRRTNFLRTSGVAAAVILLSGCVLPPVITLASIAADFASYGETGKTISDHGLSFVMQKDCSMLRVLDNEKPVCVENSYVSCGFVPDAHLKELYLKLDLPPD